MCGTSIWVCGLLCTDELIKIASDGFIVGLVGAMVRVRDCGYPRPSLDAAIKFGEVGGCVALERRIRVHANLGNSSGRVRRDATEKA